MNTFQHYPQLQYQNASPIPLKRTRAKRSCDFCRKRKSRCDADSSTPCSNCKAWGYTCEFQTVRKKRGPPSVYVDNLEKKCKKMESLLAALTNCSIKDLEQNDFKYAGHVQPSPPPNQTDSSSEDEDDDNEFCLEVQQKLVKDYDSIKYTGQSSAGLRLFDNDIFKSQSTITWPGREDTYLKLTDQNELMIIRTEKGKYDMLVDIGLSMRAPLFDNDVSRFSNTSPSPVPNMRKPAKNQLDKIIEIYFSHLHFVMPIVNKKKFLEKFHSPTSVGPSSVLMQAVLALTFRFVGQHLPDLVKDASIFADTYFRKVMKRLRDSVRSRLCNVQASLLMALYLDMDDGDVESLQWYTVGNAIRMAQDLGLHRSCIQWNLPHSEIETRHRVFYACYIMDRWIGARAGKPLTILDRDFDTDMPSPYEIEDDEASSSLKGPPIYRSFIALIKLSEILGRVLKALYAPNAKIANTNAGLDDPTILTVFEVRLQNWKNSLEEPLDGVYLSDLDKANLQLYYYTIVLLLHRPFNHLSITDYPNLKSIVAESKKACADAAKRISEIVNQRQYRTEDPAYYFVLCTPSYYVYALFQSALVYMSNARRQKTPSNIQAMHQSINLLKMNEEAGPAPRAIEILNMLVSINRLHHTDNGKTTDHDDSVNATVTTPSKHIVCPTKYAHRTDTNMNAAPKSQQLFHNRLMNTSIVGGTTPEIQSDIGLAMSRSSLGDYNKQFQLRQQPHQSSQTDPQMDCYTQAYSVYPNNHHHQHSTHQISHQRSFSLDQLNATEHAYSHTRSISHDHFDLSDLHAPSPSATANNVNTMINHGYTSQLPPPPSQRHIMIPSFTTQHSLPQVPQAYTAAYDPNMNVSNTTLPPSSLNWSDWNVYIGHQNQHTSPSLPQQQHLSSSPQHQHSTF